MFSRFVHSNGVGWGLSFSAGFAFGYHFVPFDEIRTKARKATSAWRRSRRQPPAPEPAVDTSSVHPLLASACEQESSAWWRRYSRHTGRSAASGSKLRLATNNWGGKLFPPNSPFRRYLRVHDDVPPKQDNKFLNTPATLPRFTTNDLLMTNDTTRTKSLYSDDTQHEYGTNVDDSTETLQQSSYGAQITKLPPLGGYEDIDDAVLVHRPLTPRIFTVDLPGDTSLRHFINGQKFSVLITTPNRSLSAYDDQAVDNILRDLATRPIAFTQISVEVGPGCEDSAYAGQLLNSILSILQGTSHRPDEILIRFPLDQAQPLSQYQPLIFPEDGPAAIVDADGIAIGPSHSWLQYLKKVPPMTPWWRSGQLDLSQLSQLTLSYLLPVDDFIELLSQSPSLEMVNVGWLLQPRKVTFSASASKKTTLAKLSWVSLVSTFDLETFFDAVDIPDLKYLGLEISSKTKPHTYDISWAQLEQVDIRCNMTDEEGNKLRRRCIQAVQQGKFRCTSNI